MKSPIASAVAVLALLVHPLQPNAVGAPPGRDVSITTHTMLEWMIDLDRLARAEGLNVRSAQFSSYDRASRNPAQPGWFANGDAGKFLRTEKHGDRTEYVMADMDGPGAVVRIWSANPEGGGTIRLYIDDMERPALEADFQALTEGRIQAFPKPFSGRRSRGANLYFPFLYSKHCRVTVSKPRLYYHIGYRTFPKGTRVEPFRMDLTEALAPRMKEIGTMLAAPDTARLPSLESARETRYQVHLPANREFTSPELHGPASIVRITVRVAPDAPDLAAVLRGTLLRIEFDDEPGPCVAVPLGDFFGSAPGLNPFTSLPNGMRKDGTCWSNWVMPFSKRARIVLQNTSSHDWDLSWSMLVRPGNTVEEPLYFHACRHRTWFETEPKFVDWPVLDARGAGRFVGVMLAVVNSTPTWWGEGDEKIWVDDEAFPSFFGTGSEDYFGYAWCNPGLFTHAYHNQSICTGPGNFGYTAVARYHILDDIPFQRRLRFYLEKWDASPREYAAVAYWYGAKGARDSFGPPSREDLTVRPLPEPARIKDAIEGEDLRIVRCTKGKTRIQNLGAEFSGWRHLWWVEGGPGGELELHVPAPRPGRWHVIARCTKSWDYGTFQFLVDGKPVGKPVDLYAPRITPLEVDLGVHRIGPDGLRLTLRCTGTNPKANPHNYMAGIDCVILKPVQ